VHGGGGANAFAVRDTVDVIERDIGAIEAVCGIDLVEFRVVWVGEGYVYARIQRRSMYCRFYDLDCGIVPNIYGGIGDW